MSNILSVRTHLRLYNIFLARDYFPDIYEIISDAEKNKLERKERA